MNDPNQIVGVHGWIGRVCAQFERFSPVNAMQTPGGTVWWITAEIAGMFNDVKPS